MRVETREERLERRRRERAEQVAYKLEQEIAVWDPAGIPNVTADPFKTLFVARIVSIVYVKQCKVIREYRVNCVNDNTFSFRIMTLQSPNLGGNLKFMVQ